MQMIIRLGIVVFIALAGTYSTAESDQTDFARISQQLQRQARDLRDVGKSMQGHARATVPVGLNKDQEASLAAQRRDLEAIADAALKLAIQIENRESKARSRTLTRADMDSLRVAAQPLTVLVNKRSREASMPKKLTRDGLNKTIKNVEPTDATARSKQPRALTVFENYDQRTNQLMSLLSSVMKTVNDGCSAIVRNMR